MITQSLFFGKPIFNYHDYLKKGLISFMNQNVHFRFIFILQYNTTQTRLDNRAKSGTNSQSLAL